MSPEVRGGAATRRGRCEMSGFSAVPRWILKPVAGGGEHEARIPLELVAALCQLTNKLAVPLSSVLLTAHAKVLGALSGEREVCMGYALGLGSALPLRMTLGPHSWREVLLHAARAEAAVMARLDFPVDDLRHELSLEEPSFETVFELGAGNGGELPEHTVLRIAFVQRECLSPQSAKTVPPSGIGNPGLRLRLRYKTDVLDTECAARIAGYHLTALAMIAADPDAEHARQSLLSADELRFQLDGFAGRRRDLPDRRAHELFEERARAHPDAVAAVHGNRQRTYGELNARANQLARALLARGLTREAAVGVVTERNLDWMTAMLDEAVASLSGVEKLFIDAAYEEGYTQGDLGIDVAPDQLAYIYFTSGSTGEPKGAMCEHAGMLNHLFAKIDDLKIGEGDVVAQTAPQCFDISLWQLVSALLVGGRTLLVEQETILDAKRFIDKIVEGRVNVIQVVPSYLEVLVSCLEQYPR